MTHQQLNLPRRYMLHALRMQGLSNADIARQMGCHRSTIGRELKRNVRRGRYIPDEAQMATNARRAQSRRHWHFEDWQLQMAISLIRCYWSPEQVAGWLKRHHIFTISHQTLYRYIWYDQAYGGQLYLCLRHSGKKRRKGYGKPDSRGVMGGKRHISERPLSAENRSRFGHYESDTVFGSDDQHSIVTLVDRRSKFVHIGKLTCRKTKVTNRRIIKLIERDTKPFRTITSDNGTEFHRYSVVEEKTGVPFYFCNPYHSWERGLSENTNGLIRQFLPKRKSMKNITQRDCDRIAKMLNTRPRKLLDYRTPEEADGRR
jgi:IS30 family transposase